MTLQWLRDHEACPKEQDVFAAEWPDGVVASREALVRANQIGLDLDWLARAVLPRSVYADIREEIAPLYAVYATAAISMEAEFKAQSASFLVNVHRKVDYDVAWEAHEAKIAALHLKYREPRDLLLIDALWRQYEQKGETTE